MIRSYNMLLLLFILSLFTHVAMADSKIIYDDKGRVKRVYTDIGNTTYSDDGTSYRTYGNTTYGSDGTSCRTVGNRTFCTGGKNGKRK
tara:strand:+ start:1587 stop:1850 length:264 start_codon:yes stop_codon:yes gene_type:complete